MEGTNAFSFPLSIGNFFVIPLLTTDKNLIIDRMIPANAATILTPQSFIPTHSSLSTSGFSDWYQPINKNIICGAQTPFDSYFGEQSNMEHITFSDTMVNWLKKNIMLGVQVPSFPIDPTQFLGPEYICPNSPTTYSFTDLCKIPGTASWSLSNTNAQILSSTGTSVTLKSISNGMTTLTATFQNGQTFSKEITVFANNNIPTPSGTFQLDGDVSCYDDGAKPIIFTPDTPFPGPITISPNFLPHPLRSQTRSITVKYTNPCTGEYVSTVLTFEYEAPYCPDYRPENTNLFVIYPNPVTETLNISLIDPDHKPTVISSIYGELYNSLGIKEKQIQIRDNKAIVSMNNLLQGIYTLKILYDGKVETHQIIKN